MPGPRAHLAEGDAVRPVVRAQPGSLIDAVLDGHVAGIPEVELREDHGEGVVMIRQLEVVRLRHCLPGDADTVQDSFCADLLAYDDQLCQTQRVRCLLTGLYLFWQKGCQPVVGAKKDTVIIGIADMVTTGMESHTIEILLGGQAVAVDMTDKPLLFPVVLPDAHGCRAPEIAVPCLYDIGDGLVAQLLTAREEGRLPCLLVVEVESLLSADGEVAVAEFTEREAVYPIQQLVPSQRTETSAPGVVARYSRCRTHPDVAMAVGCHGHHPVVADPSMHGVTH